ncbi:MAG: hypothetical protein F9K43_27635, partial [Bauldia sp.]
MRAHGSMADGPEVDLCGLRLAHPVINGSGTFDAIAAARVFGEALVAEFPFSAFVSKTITPEPRAGNPPPRLWETPSGLINSIGLPNKGLEGFLSSDLPRLAELPVPLIVSVMGKSHEEFARLVSGVAVRDEVAALELNVSCPNVESGDDRGRVARGDASAARRAAAADREAPDREADPQPPAGPGRARGRAGWGRRHLADQHAARDGDRPRRHAALARRRQRRALRSGRPPDRTAPGPRGRRCRLDPGGGHGGRLLRRRAR